MTPRDRRPDNEQGPVNWGIMPKRTPRPKNSSTRPGGSGRPETARAGAASAARPTGTVRRFPPLPSTCTSAAGRSSQADERAPSPDACNQRWSSAVSSDRRNPLE